MDIKTALKVVRSVSRKKKSDLTIEELAILSLANSYLKQKLVIKAYQKREAHWNKISSFLNSL